VSAALPVALAGAATSADGVTIRYWASGAGDPALVLVHAWTCDHHAWDAQVACFGAQHRVVTLDLAGHGASGHDRRDWTVEAFAGDVRAVVEALDLRRVVLVGHSMGGPIVLEAARRLPGRVVGLIPVDTLLDVESPPSAAELDQALAAFRADYAGAVSVFMRKALFAPASDPALIERIVGGAVAAPPEMALAALEHTWRYDAAAALRRITVPICAVNGDRYATDLEANRRHAPQYQALIVPGVGHYPMLEDPPRFNRRLAEAIARVTTATS
jgi:pimeloyl-ACP methyl ester carboxylesterase